MKDGEVKTSLADALQETEMVMYDIVDGLLRQTGVDVQDVSAEGVKG